MFVPWCLQIKSPQGIYPEISIIYYDKDNPAELHPILYLIPTVLLVFDTIFLVFSVIFIAASIALKLSLKKKGNEKAQAGLQSRKQKPSNYQGDTRQGQTYTKGVGDSKSGQSGKQLPDDCQGDTEQGKPHTQGPASKSQNPSCEAVGESESGLSRNLQPCDQCPDSQDDQNYSISFSSKERDGVLFVTPSKCMLCPCNPHACILHLSWQS